MDGWMDGWMYVCMYVCMYATPGRAYLIGVFIPLACVCRASCASLATAVSIFHCTVRKTLAIHLLVLLLELMPT